jgi:hypothetical protein
MTEKPVDLDAHRGLEEQKATTSRRQLHDVKVDQEALRQRQAELEQSLAAAPAKDWAEAAARAGYLLQLYALTPEAQELRRKKLIETVLDDFARLAEGP